MVYTLDGTEPGIKSHIYKEPIQLSQSKIIKIRSIIEYGRMSKVRTIVAEKQDFVKAKKILTKPGLKLMEIKGSFLKVADINMTTSSTDTIVNDIKLKFDFKNPSASIFTGFIEIPSDGIYVFSTEMDQLFIAGKLIVNNDGEVKKNSGNDGSIALENGKHAFKLIFINNIIGGYASAKNEIKVLFRIEPDKNFTEVLPHMLSY
jgi:hexosaminidase